MNVRRATLEDLQTLVDFTLKEAQESEGSLKDITTLTKGIEAALNDDSIAMYWVLNTEAEEIIGSISSLKEWSDWNAGYYWWIQSVYVLPQHRGAGHFDRLLGAVQQEMDKQGGLQLRLYVHKGNTAAIKAYEKRGFLHSQYQIMELRS